MKRLLCLAIVAVSGVCAEAPRAVPSSLLAGRDLQFEPQAAGNGYRSWTPASAVTVSSRGYIVDLAGAGIGHVAVTIAGARDIAGQGEEALAINTNYLQGASARHVSQAFRRVRYANALPGIDVVYYGKHGNFEFDFVVHPGADPREIRMRASGQERMEVSEDGDLVLHAGGERIVQHMPAVYQDVEGGRRLIAGAYQLAQNGEIHFRLDRYDRSRPLVIDPVVTYVLTPGGVGTESGTMLVQSGNLLYVAGNTTSTDFPVSSSAYQTTKSGVMDVYVMIIDPNAAADSQVIYSTFIGGAGQDELKAMVLGPGNIIYLTGTTLSSNFPLSSSPHQNKLKGTSDAFFVKLDPSVSGTSGLIYSTYFGGTAVDAAYAMAVDADSNAYITGATNSTDMAKAGTALPESNGGGGDAFVLRFDAGNGLAYSAYLGGEKWECGRGIVVEPDGALIVAGMTNSEAFPLAGAPFRSFYSGRHDMFVARLVPDGGSYTLAWATYFGGTDLDDLTSIALLPNGRVALTGYTLSQDLPLTPGAIEPGPRGSSDAYLAVFDPKASGFDSLTYSTYFGGSKGEAAYHVRADAQGRLTLAGYTMSTDYRISSDAVQPMFGGGVCDAFVAVIDPVAPVQDALVFSTYLGGTGTDIAYVTAAGAGRSLLVAGSTASRWFPSVNGIERSRAAGNPDTFLTALQFEEPVPQQLITQQ